MRLWHAAQRIGQQSGTLARGGARTALALRAGRDWPRRCCCKKRRSAAKSRTCWRCWTRWMPGAALLRRRASCCTPSKALVAAQPGHPGWRRSLSRWLQLWDLAALGTVGATLATHAGLTALRGETAEPPPGVSAVPWFLHQAARALGREDAIEALAFMRRALALDPDLAGVPETRLVREALPELERRACAAGVGHRTATE